MRLLLGGMVIEKRIACFNYTNLTLISLPPVFLSFQCISALTKRWVKVRLCKPRLWLNFGPSKYPTIGAGVLKLLEYTRTKYMSKLLQCFFAGNMIVTAGTLHSISLLEKCSAYTSIWLECYLTFDQPNVINKAEVPLLSTWSLQQPCSCCSWCHFHCCLLEQIFLMKPL